MGRGSKKRWRDLSRRKRGAIVGSGVVQLILLVVALADLWRRPPEHLNGPKPLWLAVSLVNFVGPLAYFAFGRRRSAGATRKTA
jgi:Phospholipase_D-nuclease N-terminal